MQVGLLSVSVLVFVVSCWMTKRLCSPRARVRRLDHPNERSLHHVPMPRTGGLAILASLTTGLILVGALALIGGKLEVVGAGTSLWFVGMVLLIALVSLWDDWAELPAVARLGVHLLAALGIVWGAQLQVERVGLPYLGEVGTGWLAIALAVLFLVWMTNLYNFMDGMDGFAGGMAVIGFGSLSYLAWQGEHYLTSLFSLLTVAATAGFLLYNRPPARIFMGDVGSTLLGFLAGALSLLGVRQGLFDLWVPILIFSPFIVDATMTLIRRLVTGKRVWQAHREHFYQRLVLLGWSHRKTVLVEYCLMLASGASAILYTKVGPANKLKLLVAWTLVYAALAVLVCLFERRSRGQNLQLQEDGAAG